MKSRFEIMGEDIRKQTRELVLSLFQQWVASLRRAVG